MPRVIVLMMDSFGIGGAPDAAAFGDEGADTLGHIVDKYGDLKIPNLVKLGLLEAANEASGNKRRLALAGAKLICLPPMVTAWRLAKLRILPQGIGSWQECRLKNLGGILGRNFRRFPRS